MDKNIVIVHYNTPKLTECLVKSINKFVEGANIFIFDNSDKSPFTAKFDNLTVYDNTKGQIIDFDEWLKKYPNRSRSGGRANMFGSAKHAYSVEKCMELIDAPFVLLDSDVLLKRDISNLFIEDCVYIGEDVLQPSSTIRRVLPFICFINTDMCKEHDVHYFDDNMMHGLMKTAKADRYDTGAALYTLAKNLKSVKIPTKEYVEHYGHGSWKKKGDKNPMTQSEWLEANACLWSDKEVKKPEKKLGNKKNEVKPKPIIKPIKKVKSIASKRKGVGFPSGYDLYFY